jgi:hypothetical protein
MEWSHKEATTFCTISARRWMVRLSHEGLEVGMFSILPVIEAGWTVRPVVWSPPVGWQVQTAIPVIGWRVTTAVAGTAAQPVCPTELPECEFILVTPAGNVIHRGHAYPNLEAALRAIPAPSPHQRAAR